MTPKRAIYRQQFDGTWVGNNGTKILPLDPVDYQHVDKDGMILATYQMLWDVDSTAEFFAYVTRTGRPPNREMNFKLSPYHFPRGTVVKILPHMLPEDAPQEFIVDHISQNGPRSYVVNMVEARRTRWGKGGFEAYSFNITNVVEIVKRGLGPMTFEPQEPQPPLVWETEQHVLDYLNEIGYAVPVLRKGEILISELNGRMMHACSSVNQGYWRTVNHDRLWKFVRSNAFSRPACTIPYFGLPTTLYAVDKNKYLTWLKKNLHRILVSLDEEIREEKIQQDRDMRDFHW